MKSRNGGLIRPSMTSAITHHVTASAAAQQPPRGEPPPQPVRPVAGPPDQRGQAAGQRRHRVDRAHQRDAPAPTCAASTRTVRPLPPRSARITGSSTHGASIIGRVSDEIEPSVVSTRGDSANATAAMTRDVVVPMPSASATRSSAPEADGQQQRPPQPLRHPARQPEQIAGQEERPVREQIAVGLVLRLAERQVAVPQIGRPGQEPQRVGGQVEFGVGRDHARGTARTSGPARRRRPATASAGTAAWQADRRETTCPPGRAGAVRALRLGAVAVLDPVEHRRRGVARAAQVAWCPAAPSASPRIPRPRRAADRPRCWRQPAPRTGSCGLLSAVGLDRTPR